MGIKDFKYLYILDVKTAVPTDDAFEWSRRFESDNRVIARTAIQDVEVSTVFLGIDLLAGLSNRPPMLFETMIFGGDEHVYLARYSTYDEALTGHDFACRKVVGC